MVSRGKLLVWDWEDQRMVLDLDPGGLVRGTPALSPEGTLLAFIHSGPTSGTNTDFLTILDLQTKKIYRRFPGLEGPLQFRSSSLLMAQQPGGKTILLDLISGQTKDMAPPPAPVPVMEGEKMILPRSRPVENLVFLGKDPALTLEYHSRRFTFSPPTGWSETASIVPAVPMSQIPPPEEVSLPPGGLGLWNDERTLFIHTDLNNQLVLRFQDPGDPEALTARYHHHLLPGSPEIMVLSPGNQWLAVGDDLGFLLLWNLPGGTASGLWDFNPVQSGGLPRTILWDPLPPLASWNPRDTPFPSGVLALASDTWSGETPGRLPWSDSPPAVLQDRKSPASGAGFVIPRSGVLSQGTSVQTFWNDRLSLILLPGGEVSRLIRLGSEGVPDLQRILPGTFSKIRSLPQGEILVLGTETVPHSSGKVKILLQILNPQLETLATYRSYFLASSVPQVQSAEDSDWVGLHWPERSRSSWTSTLRFYNFKNPAAWTIQIPLALDLSGFYTPSQPEILSRLGKGTFLLPYSGALNSRTRETGTAFAILNPQKKDLSARFLPMPPDFGVTAAVPLDGLGFTGLTPLGPMVWEEGKPPVLWSLPKSYPDRSTMDWWSGTPSGWTLPLGQAPGAGAGFLTPQGRLESWVKESQEGIRYIIQHQSGKILLYQPSREKEDRFLWISREVPAGDPLDLENLSHRLGRPMTIPAPYHQDHTPLLGDWEPLMGESKFTESPYFLIPTP